MDYSTIYKKTEQYVIQLFEDHHPVQFVFHNLQHTQNVVNRTNEISGHYQLSEKDMLIVFIAAWFHDTGYLFVPAAQHEEKSVGIMREFVKKYDVPGEIADEVAACIMATRHPRNPSGLLQEIICDADTYQFGSKEFKQTNKLAYQEVQNHTNGIVPKQKFDEDTLEMLKHHQFYTSYCRDLLSSAKKANMKKLKKNKEKVKDGEPEVPEVSSITEKQGTTKGMQTMLRLTSSNHIQLSEMADSKANILISVNAIIISVILSVLLRKLQTDPYLTIPTIIFLAAAVATIVVAILATRPKLNQGTFMDEDIVNKKTNLLFFGNFHKMPQAEYETAMRTMMQDSDYLYSSIIQDIYHLGVVLGKKYKLIRLAYNIFMFGIIISVIAFGVAAFLNDTPPPAAVTNSTGSPF
ncbi:MAG: metal-dependent phosphohydrolase sub domain protein [Ferruginibacter sp.]|nr:metal-dependent phosphohydrolase sub domain protein [Ferruginibacter sp.]